jgi:hypothetical protein
MKPHPLPKVWLVTFGFGVLLSIVVLLLTQVRKALLPVWDQWKDVVVAYFGSHPAAQVLAGCIVCASVFTLIYWFVELKTRPPGDNLKDEDLII